MTSEQNSCSKKASYKAPRVTEFGSVRNLTGGSGGQASDGGGLMTMML
ncbi:lasso RiPP family leader peptide-containing protein [Erythrobacter alti]